MSILCSSKPVTSIDELKALLNDRAGVKYYQQMKELKVDTKKLANSLEKTCKSRLRTWLNMCAKCAICADSCISYIANDCDPSQIPSYKIQSTLGEIIKKNGNVDNEFMINTMEVAYAKCTCCNRCALYCPFGIDVGVMISYLRGLLFEQGFVPYELKIGSGMHRIYGAQMDVTDEDFLDTCEWLVEEYSEEFEDFEIPVDKKNADIMYVLNAREIKHYPQDMADAVSLFKLAGEDFTVPSHGWEATSLSMFAGDFEGCRYNVERVYDAVKRLNPKQVVSTECGHAYRATAIEGPYFADIKDGKTEIPYTHYVKWLALALREGKLKIDPTKKIKNIVTIQDSCNYVRNGGLAKYTREIMSYIAEDFREMEYNKEHAFCCGGGGGLNGIGIYKEHRNKNLAFKLAQIKQTGANLVIAPCHNCYDAIRDMLEIYKVHDVKVSLLKPLILSSIIK